MRARIQSCRQQLFANGPRHRHDARGGPVARQRHSAARHGKGYASRDYQWRPAVRPSHPSGRECVRLVNVHDIEMSLA